jgi:TonB family protein
MTTAMDQFARDFLTLLLDSSVRTLAVAGLVGLALFALRVRTASIQGWAWTIVLYAALVMPALTALTPEWRLPLPSALAITDWIAAPATTSAPLALGTSTATFQASATTSVSGVSWLVVALAIYVAIALFLLARAVLGSLIASRLRRSASPISDATVLARLARVAATTGLEPAPVLVESPRVCVPITLSVIDPALVLPAGWREWSVEKLEAVLAHETAHVARRDLLTQRIALLNRAVFWGNPLSWWLVRRLEDAAEQASDDAALAGGIEPTAYAETLLDFFVELRRAPSRANWNLAMARSADAEAARRVERILAWTRGRKATLRRSVMLAMILVAVPVVGLTASIGFDRNSASIDHVRNTGTDFTLPLVTSSAPAPQTTGKPPATQKPAPSTKKPAPSTQKASAKPAAAPVTDAKKPVDQNPQKPAAQAPVEDQTKDEDFLKGAYELGTPGVFAPTAVRPIQPRYTSDAMRNKIQGQVVLDIIVMPDGSVGKARVAQSLDTIFGLDEAALTAAKQWTFIAGTFNGVPVPVHVQLNLDFRLH